MLNCDRVVSPNYSRRGAHGFDEGSGTEVSNGTQDALGDAHDEVEGVVGECVVGPAGYDESAHGACDPACQRTNCHRDLLPSCVRKC